MDQDLTKKKQEIKKRLSLILGKLPKLKSKKDKTELEFNYKQAIKEISKLYYYSLYHIDRVNTLPVSAKQKVKNNILDEYKANLVKLVFLFDQQDKLEESK